MHARWRSGSAPRTWRCSPRWRRRAPGSGHRRVHPEARPLAVLPPQPVPAPAPRCSSHEDL
eukprot:scaffold92926_cov54-Phaeocystis_antarctica.AAC.2